MRYYDGKPPEVMTFGTARRGANFEPIEKTTEVASGITLIALVHGRGGAGGLARTWSRRDWWLLWQLPAATSPASAQFKMGDVLTFPRTVCSARLVAPLRLQVSCLRSRAIRISDQAFQRRIRARLGERVVRGLNATPPAFRERSPIKRTTRPCRTRSDE
jgi:hypothetical protein